MSQPKTWAEIRAVVLYRDKYLCQICNVAEATEADHIWPRIAGGPDELENLQAACGPCNKSKGGAYYIWEATEQQLLWLQNHQNTLAAEAERAALATRAHVSLWGAGLAGDDRKRLLGDVPDAEMCEEGSELALTFALLARTSWSATSYGWITPDQIETCAARLRSNAQFDYEQAIAECEAAEKAAARMREHGYGRLVDLCDVDLDRGVS